jgi:hypothetical protein
MSGDPPQSNTPNSVGRKRYHDEEMPWSFVISQEAEEDGHHHHHDHKRLRMRMTSLPDSPGVVSISSMMDCSSIPQKHLENVLETSQQPNQWWKQKHTPNHYLPPDHHTTTTTGTTPCCFVCQRPPPSQQQQQLIPHAQVMPYNALLSYFAPKNASTTCTFMPVDTKPISESFHSCFFCTRQACSSCTRPCESCGHTFCSLCSTVDYTTRAERTFCLDCPKARAKDDAMNLDSNE